MAKVVLKKTPIHAVVRCTAAGSYTIALATDLPAARQTPTASIAANIQAVFWTVPAAGSAKVTRNGVDIWEFGPGWGEWRFNGWNETENNGQDIVITLTGNASLTLELVKIGDWGDNQTLNQAEV